MPLSLLRHTALLLVAVLGLAGCAAIRPQAAFDDVQQTLESRTDIQTVWRTGASEDARADRAVDSLLALPLTAEAAVQVALLNNRRLQAIYEDLGVAQADLVQAGLLANPIFGAGALWALDESGAPDLRFTVSYDFLSVFFLPLRRSIAQSAYEAARLRVAEAVLGFSADTRTAFFRAQADAAQLDLQRTVVANAEAAYTAALLLREAGNVPAVDLLAEQARFEQARLDLVSAEAQAVESRERLARMMGVFGANAAFNLEGTLPPATDEDLLLGDLEATAVEASLALQAAAQDVITYGRRLGLERPESLIPEFHAGAELEREDGEWELGSDVEIALPVLDGGQARTARARAELRRRQARYYALGVEVRSATRTLAQRLAAAQTTALQYQTVILPLRAELTAQTLRQYNAMQTGVFGLLQAQQMEVDANRRYLDRLAAYWQARTDVALLLQGGMPSLDAGVRSMADSEATSISTGDAGH